MPPRHGKSETSSRWFPSWFIGNFPDKRVILASYEADFAASWGRKTRDVISDVGAELYGVRLRQDSHSVSRWDVEKRVHGRWVRAQGGMVTAGVGGPITGRGAHILLIDDPIKNAKESLSKVKRDDAKDWYRSTARTRLEPDAAVVLIMTRWHEQDLAGWLLQQMLEDESAERWERISLPALAEANDPLGRAEGDALWPERFPVSELMKTRTALGTYWWSALYQQQPKPPSGLGKFNRNWFDVVPGIEEDIVRWCRYWDLAATQPSPDNDDPDWTVGALLGQGESGRVYVADIVRDRGTPHQIDNLMARTTRLDQDDLGQVAVRVEQEPGSSGKRDAENIKRTLRRAVPGCRVEAVRVTGPKELRANPFAAAAEREQVTLVAGAWNDAFLEEAEDFPFGSHDDQIDAVSGAYEYLAGLGVRRPRLRA